MSGRSHWGAVIGELMVLNRSVTLFLPFLYSASDGLERTPFLLKETWTPLPLVEAGNDFFLLFPLLRSVLRTLFCPESIQHVWQKQEKRDFSFFTTLCLFLPAAVTLACGWMRICTWVAAAPATPSITAASQKPTTSASWSWRCGRSAEESERPQSFSKIDSPRPPADQLCQDGIYHW